MLCVRGSNSNSASAQIKAQIERAEERLWRHQDFIGLPVCAVNQTLSRLARRGILMRIRKGLYFGPTNKSRTQSLPSEDTVLESVLRHRIHPAGRTAAHILGLIALEPEEAEYATAASEAPSNLPNLRVFTGRSKSRDGLSEIEGAILEILRMRAMGSERSAKETIGQLVQFLRCQDTFVRLARAALDEPPRVRAMLGALGQEIEANRTELALLRASLNPISRFDFGLLKGLRFAREWQSK